MGKESWSGGNVLSNGMICIPTNQKHCKVHCSGGKNQVEETIAVWDIIIFVLFVILPELHLLSINFFFSFFLMKNYYKRLHY